MSTFLTYEELRAERLIRTPLNNEPGREWQRALGERMDVEFQRTVWARRARWPEWAPEDGLLYIGRERKLEQVALMRGDEAPEREATADYRLRLRGAWGIWNLAGSHQGHLDAFSWTELENVSIHRRKEWSTPYVDAATPEYVKAFQLAVWSQFDVLIERPHPWEGVFWGQFNWGGVNWGSTATTEEVDQLRRLLWNFRSAHDTPTWIVVNLNRGAHLWGGFSWADGTTWNTGTGPGAIRWLVGEPHWRTRGLL